jgi:hypothetical protein
MVPAVQPTEPQAATVAFPKLSEMEIAEQKLAALVGKKEGLPARHFLRDQRTPPIKKR